MKTVLSVDALIFQIVLDALVEDDEEYDDIVMAVAVWGDLSKVMYDLVHSEVSPSGLPISQYGYVLRQESSCAVMKSEVKRLIKSAYKIKSDSIRRFGGTLSQVIWDDSARGTSINSRGAMKQVTFDGAGGKKDENVSDADSSATSGPARKVSRKSKVQSKEESDSESSTASGSSVKRGGKMIKAEPGSPCPFHLMSLLKVQKGKIVASVTYCLAGKRCKLEHYALKEITREAATKAIKACSINDDTKQSALLAVKKSASAVFKA